MEIVAPEFIFYEYGHGGACRVEESSDAFWGVEREVDHRVDEGVIFPDFESGG